MFQYTLTLYECVTVKTNMDNEDEINLEISDWC